MKILGNILEVISDIHTLNMQNVCLQLYRNNKSSEKVVNFLRKIQTLRTINSKILRIQNVKFLGYCFYIQKYGE